MERYTLGLEAIAQVRRLVREQMSKVRPADVYRQQPGTNFAGIYICLSPAGGIDAIDGSTPGSAECEVYWIINGDLAAAEDSDGEPITVTVYNISSGAISGDVYIQCKQEMASGCLIADFEDCSSGT